MSAVVAASELHLPREGMRLSPGKGTCILRRARRERGTGTEGVARALGPVWVNSLRVLHTRTVPLTPLMLLV